VCNARQNGLPRKTIRRAAGRGGGRAGIVLAAAVATLYLLPVSRAEMQLRRLLPQATNAIGYLAVTDPMEIVVPDRQASRGVGERMLYFGENDRALFALTEGIEDPDVYAFPRVDAQGHGVAWVSHEKQLIFGVPARTISARLDLAAPEVLAVIAEDSNVWTCVLERYGREAVFEVPRRLPGLAFSVAAPAAWTARRAILRPDLAAALRARTIVASGNPPSPPLPGPRDFHGTGWVLSAVSPTGAAVRAAGGTTNALATGSEAWLREARKWGLILVEFARQNPVAATATGGALIIAASFLLDALRGRRDRRAVHPALPRWKRDREVFPTEPVRLSLAPRFTLKRPGAPAAETDHAAPAPAADGDLRGELKVFSMGQLVQFFHSSGESGTLTLGNGSTGPRDFMVFDRGAIVDARAGKLNGVAAADHLLRRHHGAFSFRREDNSRRKRNIDSDTLALLFEAHRRIDEVGWSD
jgi:hypothetical protein